MTTSWQYYNNVTQLNNPMQVQQATVTAKFHTALLKNYTDPCL